MTAHIEIEFHSERAMAELDMALRAGSVPAAKAHFSLSTLHSERADSLRARQPAELSLSEH